MTTTDKLTDEAPLSDRLRAHCIGQPATVAWPHRILHEAIMVVQAAEDVAHGRGMFGVDAKADLEWAMTTLQDALDHRRASQAAPAHEDDLAVDRFAAVMKAKLAKKRDDGRWGWEREDECSAADLSRMLRDHVAKGDPVDVANFAMMLHQRGERIAQSAPAPSDGTCADCGCAPVNADSLCATCVDERHAPAPSDALREAQERVSELEALALVMEAELNAARAALSTPTRAPSDALREENARLRRALDEIRSKDRRFRDTYEDSDCGTARFRVSVHSGYGPFGNIADAALSTPTEERQ